MSQVSMAGKESHIPGGQMHGDCGKSPVAAAALGPRPVPFSTAFPAAANTCEQ